MMYVDKDAAGNVTACYPAQQYAGQAAVSANDAGLLAFMNGSTPPQLRNALVAQARAALCETDRVACRCLKVAIPYPPEWLAYSQALNAIVNGTDTTSTVLPVQPAYPAGT